MPLPDSVRALERDLRGVFGSRLRSLVMYGARAGGAGHDAHGHADPHAPPVAVRTLAVVEAMTVHDLRAAARQVERWHEAGLATPLLLGAHEFERSLDAFPLEFGAILADHEMVTGESPFEALTVDAADVRRACEVQARSHLVHLREGVLETRGRGDALSLLILQSAPAFSALVASLARLVGGASENPDGAARHVERTLGVPDGPIGEVVRLTRAHDLSSADAERLIAPYLDAVERIVAYVDGWSDGR
jgi:hypothetical protein